MERVFCLFNGRHELPENEGAIASDFDFQNFLSVRTGNWEIAKQHIAFGGKVKILVTGLTPVLTEFIAECYGVGLVSMADAYDAGDIISSGSLDPMATNCPVGYIGGLSLLHFDNSTKSYREQVIF